MNTYDVLGQVANERVKQIKKWGHQEHRDLYWLGILMEEVGEVAKNNIEDGSYEGLRIELLHVAAVAVAWIETLPEV